jgi:hypothetical protein
MTRELFESYVGSTWQAIGPVVVVLVGVLVGSLLARRSERKRWLADNKKEEYRELLKELGLVYRKLIDLDGPLAESDEAWSLCYQAEGAFLSCIFIDSELSEQAAQKEWDSALTEFMNTEDHGEFEDRYKKLRKELVSAAQRVTLVS